MFDALFLHAEQQATSINSESPSNTGKLIIKFLPIMAIVEVPERFKRFLAMRLALDLIEVDTFFETCDERADMDDVCNVQHEQGVACRRRKVDCVTSENALDDSTVPTKERLTEDGESLCKKTEGVTAPNSEISKTASGEALENGQCSQSEKGSELLGSAVSHGASGSDANGIHVEEEGSVEAASGGNDQGETSGEAAASSQGHYRDEVEGEEVEEVVERVVSVVAENEEGESADVDGAQEGPLGDQNAEEGEEVNGEVEAEVEAPENEENVADEENGANEGEGEDEDDVDDLEALPEPCVPPPPYPVERKAWHKEFDVWKVFQQQKMMRLFIYYLSHYGALDYRMFLLDIVLTELEPALDNDDEVIDLLRQIDWNWEGPTYEMLSVDFTANWSSRAWRLLALAKLSCKQMGVDVRMNWAYHNLFNDIHEKAAQLANKNDDSDANSSNSSDDELEPGFSAEWNDRAGDQGFEFGMRLHCLDPDPDEVAPLTLNIRLVERNEEVWDKKSARREVTSRIKVIECGCGCALGDAVEYQGFTASLTRNAEDQVEKLESFRREGNKYQIMDGSDLDSWMKRHGRQCGLLFQVRLYISPLKEIERKRGSNTNDERKVECLCGFCNDDANGESS